MSEHEMIAETDAIVAHRNPFNLKRWVVLLCICAAVCALDQWTKQWAHTTLRSKHRGQLTVIKKYVALSYVRNPGAAWGLFAKTKPSFRKPFFVTVSLVALTFMVVLFLRLRNGQHMLLLGLSLVMGGAIGNLIDRLRYGYVIDFLDFHIRNKYRWPTFNVADIAISVGVGFLLLDAWLSRDRGEPTPNVENGNENA